VALVTAAGLVWNRRGLNRLLTVGSSEGGEVWRVLRPGRDAGHEPGVVP
jgi:hypothetical protein